MQDFIITLLICSVTMSALALIYILAMPLLSKKYSVKAHYYTWLIIVIGLIIPFRPHWNNAIIQVDVPSKTANTIMQMGTQIGKPMENQLIDQTGNQLIGQAAPALGSSAPAAAPMPILNPEFTAALQSVSWGQAALTVWLAGVILFLAYHAIKHYRFTKAVKRWSKTITDEEQIYLLQSLQSEMGITKPMELCQCTIIGSPMMAGFTHPRILLPEGNLELDELRFILKHELVHYKRKDLYYKFLVLIATAIHWFNPVVRLIARTIEMQCELSCDAETVKSADEETRQQYSETIIGVVKYRAKVRTALSTSFYVGKKGMKKRIFSIMDMDNKKAGIALFCIALMVTLGTGMAASGTSYAQPLPESTVAGDIIKLGGLEWRVLEVKDGKALVLSDKVLLNSGYHSIDTAITWEECDLRQYLNGTFYDAVFSAKEKTHIVETMLKNEDNPWYHTSAGNYTTDKVFLLSIDEVLQYFGDSGAVENRKNGTTFISDEFNEARMARTMDGEASLWWLRSPGLFYLDCYGADNTCAVTITASGSMGVQGSLVDSVGGVRPAMWINLE